MAIKELKMFKQLARYIGRDEADKIQHGFQRLSILLMKGNAALITSRVPSSASNLKDINIEETHDL